MALFFVVNNVPIPTGFFPSLSPIVTEFSPLVKTTWFYLRILAVGIELIQNKKDKNLATSSHHNPNAYLIEISFYKN